MDALKAYIETALRIANSQFETSTDPTELLKLGKVITYLETALDALINDYSSTLK